MRRLALREVDIRDTVLVTPRKKRRNKNYPRAGESECRTAGYCCGFGRRASWGTQVKTQQDKLLPFFFATEHRQGGWLFRLTRLYLSGRETGLDVITARLICANECTFNDFELTLNPGEGASCCCNYRDFFLSFFLSEHIYK